MTAIAIVVLLVGSLFMVSYLRGWIGPKAKEKRGV